MQWLVRVPSVLGPVSARVWESKTFCAVHAPADGGMKLVDDTKLAGAAMCVHPRFGAFLSPYNPKAAIAAPSGASKL